jgi:hypothetical protein
MAENAPIRFVCECGLARDFPRTTLHDVSLHDARASDLERARANEADYWERVHELRAAGWAISERFGTKCPECKRRANSKLLDRPLRSVGR